MESDIKQQKQTNKLLLWEREKRSQSWTWFWRVCIRFCKFWVSWLLLWTRAWRFSSDTPPPWEPWLAVSLCRLGLLRDDLSLKTGAPTRETQQQFCMLLLLLLLFFNLAMTPRPFYLYLHTAGRCWLPSAEWGRGWRPWGTSSSEASPASGLEEKQQQQWSGLRLRQRHVCKRTTATLSFSSSSVSPLPHNHLQHKQNAIFLLPCNETGTVLPPAGSAWERFLCLIVTSFFWHAHAGPDLAKHCELILSN